MLEHLLCFSVVRMVKVFKVSRSGFYYWIKHRHKAIQREATRQEFDAKVKDAFDNSKGRDGSRRIQKELVENGDSHNVKCVIHRHPFNYTGCLWTEKSNKDYCG